MFKIFVFGHNHGMNKAFTIFCISILGLFVLSVVVSAVFNSVNKTNPDKYFVYYSRLPDTVPEDAVITDLGFCYQVESSHKITQEGVRIGETIAFGCKQSDVNRLLGQNGISIDRSYNVGKCAVFEGRFTSGKNVGKKVQAAFNQNVLSIGSPVIFGSY